MNPFYRHTHNDVDQFFSVMAGKLKRKEMPCFENLLNELKNLKVDQGNPVVVEMLSTTDFSSLIIQHLNQISGHTQFFQFKILREKKHDGSVVTKLYVKRNSLEEKWDLFSGVKLLKSSPDLKNLKVASFREDSVYSEILKSVSSKYFPTLVGKYSKEEETEIRKNWEKRIKFLLSCNPASFQPFSFEALRCQAPRKDNETVVENIQRSSSSGQVALTATFYPNEISSFSVEDLKQDDSVVFYTAVKKSRPWIGLYMGLSKDDDGNNWVEVQWLKRDKKKFFLDLSDVGSPYLSKLQIESIMFTDVLQNLSSSGERTGPYVMDPETLKEIKAAYAERDESLV